MLQDYSAFVTKFATNSKNYCNDSDVLLDELAPNHLERDVHGVRRLLPFAQGVIVVGDIDRDFGEFQALGGDLFHKFARVLHSVHGEADFFDRSDPQHPVPVVGIRETHSGNEPSEDFAAHEDEPSEKGDVGIGFDDEAGTEDDIE